MANVHLGSIPNDRGYGFSRKVNVNAATDDASGAGDNAVVLYAEDNGAGKTQLVPRFASGAAVVIATQP